MALVDTLAEREAYKFALVYNPKQAADVFAKAGYVDATFRFDNLIAELKLYLSGRPQTYANGTSTITELKKVLGPGSPNQWPRVWDLETVRKKLEQTEKDLYAFVRGVARSEGDVSDGKRTIRGNFDSAVSFLESSFSGYKHRLYEFIKKRDGVGPTNLNLKDRPNMIKEIIDMVAYETAQNKAAREAAKAANVYVRKCKRCPSAPLKPPTVPPVDNKKLNNRLKGK